MSLNRAIWRDLGMPYRVIARRLTLLPQLGLDFHKNKTFCVFNPLIFRTGIFDPLQRRL